MSRTHIYWNELRMPTTNALVERLKKVSVLSPQPEVQIRGDGRGNYDGVGRVIYACQRAGISKVGFITEPPDTRDRELMRRSGSTSRT